jgi:heat shock protein HslJ
LKQLAIALCVTLLLVWAQLTQDSPGPRFPFDTRFVAATIDGKRFNLAVPVLKVSYRAPFTYYVAGTGGCNHFGSSSAFIGADAFYMRVGYSTAMYCGSGSEVEAWFLPTLQAARRWRMEDNALILTSGRHVIRFERASDGFGR